MAVPNLQYVVVDVRASQVWPFRSKADLCAYSNACVEALHATDADFGHLKKTPPQNHCTDTLGRPHAVDVTLYRPTGQVVDFIVSAGFEPDLSQPEPENAVCWIPGPVNEYGPDEWFAPVGDVEPPDRPDPPPDDAELEQRVTDLEAAVAVLEQQAEKDRKRMEDINTRFDEESKNLNVHKPLPDYEGIGTGEGRLFGYRIPVTVTVTSRPKG